MPFSFRIDEARDVLFIEAGGLLTPGLLQECVEEYMAHPGFHAEMDIALCCGEDAVVKIGGRQEEPVVLARENVLGEIRALIALERGEAAYRVACVGGSTKVKTFFMAGAGLINTRSEIAAFDDLPKALEWLGKEQEVTQTQ